MASDRTSRAETGTIAGVLANLRRAPKRVRRHSREVIENAVSQLFDAAVRHPDGAPVSGEYRIDELARLAGTTTRNIRVYRDRGLLPPPLRVGRIALFNDTHLARLRLITSMLDRGYTIAHVREMLSAWEEGKNLGDVLGLETAIVGTWTTEKPETMSLSEAQRLIDDRLAFVRLVKLQLIRVDGATATITRPKLIDAFTEIRGYGIDMGKLIDLHERIVPLVDQISEMLVRTGAEHVADRIKPGQPLPAD
ncbi:MAG TPA: MerR family transcriptional regulator, partial [Mycobacterium sp.]|nr:MerR family transcriptional regulator [Mycobacterium sp.]